MPCLHPAHPAPASQLNDWFLASRNPETGEYADLPAADKGGSRDIIHPSPPQPTAEEAGAAAAKAGKAGAATGKGASSGKPGGGKGKAAAGKEAPKCSQAFLEGLRAAVQQYMDVWQEYEPCDPSAALREWHAVLRCAAVTCCCCKPAGRRSAAACSCPPPLCRPGASLCNSS